MNVLGISCYFHDAAAALLVDGKLIAAAEEERFTRKKHDYEFPQRAIDFCLRMGCINAADLDYVVFFEKPFVKFERLLLSSMQTFPRSHRVFREAMITWLGDKLWIKHLIQKRLGIAPTRILFSEHHLSHAASVVAATREGQAQIDSGQIIVWIKRKRLFQRLPRLRQLADVVLRTSEVTPNALPVKHRLKHASGIGRRHLLKIGQRLVVFPGDKGLPPRLELSGDPVRFTSRNN
jgi:hypothetical protein